jgi:hypothetical protein
MTQHRTELATLLSTPLPRRTGPADGPTRWPARLSAKVFGTRYDREIELGVPIRPASALAFHAARITSRTQREQLARALRSALEQEPERLAVFTSRVPVHRDGITKAADVVGDITAVLATSGPVRARGMARLRLLLGDGAGPLYQGGRGSLAAELRGVLAAL